MEEKKIRREKFSADALKSMLHKINMNANVYICIENEDDKKDELQEITDVLIGYELYDDGEHPYIILKSAL